MRSVARVKIASIVGNRPQFIKAAPTSVALREYGLDEVVVHTGQHYDRELSQVFFEELGLAEPRYRLDLRTADPQVMQPPIEACLGEERPDWVLVYGDTNSTLAGALAAASLELPLAHVEAGLRSGDLSMPEERNRIETDRLAQLLLCPDERSRQTLAAEGVPNEAHLITGGRPVYLYDIFQNGSAFPGSTYPFGARVYRPGDCPIAEQAFNEWITMNLFEHYTDGDIDEIGFGIAKVARYFIVRKAVSISSAVVPAV